MRTVFFSALLFFALSASAQEPVKKEKNGQKMDARTEATVTAPPTTTTSPNVTADGANLTPEQQGFTKKTIDGKEVYLKQSGQMIIYYEPRK